MADLELDGPNSAISVDTLKPKTGTTLTIGESGDTIALGLGATSTGFGPSGAVSWDTTEKTSDFNAVSGIGYFVDTTSASITATLPSSPSAGDIVAFKDYAGTFGTNSLTIDRNGENIQGNANDSQISTNRASVVLVYVDATKGWLYTNESNVGDLESPTFIQATGGTITTSGDYKIHTFTSSGTFTVTELGNPIGGPNDVDYMVVAGGGGGGYLQAGGGGAGGFRESVPSPADWTASPLANPGNALPVSVQGYPVTVGGGGAGRASPGAAGTSGSNSIFSTITSAGGGGGGSGTAGAAGGSGGGGGENLGGGTGNSPSVSPPQGTNGGAGLVPHISGGGGGGATDAGSPSVNNTSAGPGGDGATTSISGSPVAYAGGGGGGPGGGTATTGGTGGGGGSSPGGGTPGTANTGGGGGSNDFPAVPGTTGGDGGSGVVILRYKFQ
jgi:hypothetical protein